MGASVSSAAGRRREAPLLPDRGLGCCAALSKSCFGKSRRSTGSTAVVRCEAPGSAPLLTPGAAAPLRAAAGGLSGNSAPPSFKASRPRKTQDVIGGERQNPSRLEEPWEVPVPVDAEAQLLEEADAHTVTEKVAHMIYRYIEEGDLAAGAGSQGVQRREFDEANFLSEPPRGLLSNCLDWLKRSAPAPSSRATPEAVYRLIDDMATPLYFCKQVVVLCAIYIDRLLEETSPAMLNSDTWRCIVTVTLVTASKVWEDVHPWNADFEACLQEEAGIYFLPGALYRLESLFLGTVRWRVFVDGEMYAAYFFSLMTDRSDQTTRSSVDLRRHQSENFDTIIEDEPYYAQHSDSDLERIPFDGDAGSDQYFSPSGASAHVSNSPFSPSAASLSWSRLLSREDLVSEWRKDVLDSGESSCGGAALKAKRAAWKLDARNPHIGALRHAPRAPAPSRHLPHSEELLWTNMIANASFRDFGPPSSRCRQDASANTISGATGSQLASEVRRYLDSRHDVAGTPARSNSTTASSSPRATGSATLHGALGGAIRKPAAATGSVASIFE